MSKPFNLEEFKEGREAITRDGQRARYVAFVEGITWGLVILIEGESSPLSFRVGGQCSSINNEHPFDLIRMAPVRRELWARAFRLPSNKIDAACSARLSTNRQHLESDRPYETNTSCEWAQDSEPVLVHSWEEE